MSVMRLTPFATLMEKSFSVVVLRWSGPRPAVARVVMTVTVMIVEEVTTASVMIATEKNVIAKTVTVMTGVVMTDIAMTAVAVVKVAVQSDQGFCMGCAERAWVAAMNVLDPRNIV